jgi:tetratricopeptide (TPR) repeat protein
MSGGRRGAISRNTAFFLSLVALLAVAVYAWAETEPTAPRESLCAQAKPVRQAGLLAKARDLYAQAASEGHECGEAGRWEAEVEQRRAAGHFDAARLQAAAAPAEPTAEEKKAAQSADAKEAIAKTEGARQNQVQAATAEYLAGLEINPFDQAGRLGLESTLAALHPRTGALYFCGIANRLARAGLLDQAAATMAKGLLAAPAVCAAAKAQVELRRQLAVTSLRQGQQLEASGETPTAREWFAQALRADTGLGDARSGLENSIDESSFLDDVGSWIGAIPGALKEALAWLVPVALALFLLALLGWILLRELAAQSQRARAAMKAMAKARPLGFLKLAAVPTVTVDDFEGADGAKDFSTLLRVQLPKESGREPAFALDYVAKGSASDGAAADLAKVFAEVGETKLLGVVLEALGKLFRRRAIRLRGYLQTSGDRGAGITLTLEGAGIPADSTITLWEETFDPAPSLESDEADRWMRLVPAATVWARWQLAAAHLSAGEDSPDPEDWEADAFFRCGVAHQAQADWVRAEALYVMALESDPALLPARHNLAMIEIRHGRYAEAERDVRAVREALEADARQGSHAHERWPTLETASLYTLALALCYPALVSDSPTAAEQAKLGEALAKTEELVRKLAQPGKELATDPRVRAELKAALAPTVVVLASLKVRHHPGLAVEAARRATRAKPSAPKISCERLRSRLNQLQPADLIEGFVLRQPHVSRRSHYNLACYYTTLARHSSGERQQSCYDLALDSLSKALVGKELSRWAGHDPSLQPLLENRPDRVAKLHVDPAPHPRRKKPQAPAAGAVTSSA